jgi:hypothetical protein
MDRVGKPKETKIKEDNSSPTSRLSQKAVEELYREYAKSHGDCEDPVDFSPYHGAWELVGHGRQTNQYCGNFYKFKICNRTDLHSRPNCGPNGVEASPYAGKVFVRKTFRSCNNPRCPVCCFSGWARREADKIAQRIEAASNRYGKPQHIIIPIPESDYRLAEFQNYRMRVKIKKVLFDRGVVGGCLIFHGFRYANYQESIEKGVLFGWRWSPHFHCIGFILGGYGKCRKCAAVAKQGRSICFNCDEFEGRTRRLYKIDNYLVKVLDERITVFGTAWYQLNHSAIKVGS